MELFNLGRRKTVDTLVQHADQATELSFSRQLSNLTGHLPTYGYSAPKIAEVILHNALRHTQKETVLPFTNVLLYWHSVFPQEWLFRSSHTQVIHLKKQQNNMAIIINSSRKIPLLI